MKDKNKTSLFNKEMVKNSVWQAIKKLDPKTMIKNPVMFLVEICTAIMAVVTVTSATTNDSVVLGNAGYNIAVFIILFMTLL